MKTLQNLARRYTNWRDDTDPYLMAATLALVGEPDLAREILDERDRGRGAPQQGDESRRLREERGTLACELAS